MTLSQSLEKELKQVAGAAADAANKVTLSYFRFGELATESKEQDGYDPVTRADREAELAIRDVLAQLRPDDGILGEEFGQKAGTTGLTWILDPIDGTRGFVAGTPNWGTLISVERDGQPLLGQIDQPYIGERFLGVGTGATLRHGGKTRDIGTRATRPLSEAIIFTTFPEVGTKEQEAAFHRLARKTQLTRYGMDCYAYALLAAGQIDLVVEAGLAKYDIHAPAALIAAAGGIVTDWKGGPAHQGGDALAAANPEIHAAAMAVLND